MPYNVEQTLNRLANTTISPNRNVFDAPPHHAKYTMNRKYKCIVRPAQSGKTRTMQELMLEYDRLGKIFYKDDESFLDIIVCSKNLNLVKQTHARMKKELFVSSDEDDDASDSASADAKIEGDIFSWMTGTKDTNISPEALVTKICLGDVRMVICCAHKKRLKYVADLLSILDRARFFKDRVNIWMDEADDYVNIWSSSEVDFPRFNKVNDIYLVSATVDAIVEKFDRIKVKPFASTYPACYHKTVESHIVEIPATSRDPMDYLNTVYSQHNNTLCVPGMRVFVPGDITVKSHDQIADFLVAEGFAVCILNGKKKCIRVPGMEEPLVIAEHVPVGEIMEVGKTIAIMYRDYNLSRFPFAITGKICLSRGITFQCEDLTTVLAVQPDGTLTSSSELSYDFLFDAGIMPPMSDRATLYQCVSRVNGNIKNFRNYKVPTLYMSKETRETIFGAEKIAENLATLVHTHNLADVGKEEMNWAIHGDEAAYRNEVEASSRHSPSTAAASHRIYYRKTKEFATMGAARKYYAERFGSEDGLAETKLQKEKDSGKFKCSFANVKSEVQTVDTVRAHLNSGNLWGENYKKLYDATTAPARIGTIKVGYTGDVPVFFLCVVSRTDFEL
jgi:hypothetical protein